ncbi:MAG: bifunctional nuclease domain-containing protein [Marinilabiliaceae bacterium]
MADMDNIGEPLVALRVAAIMDGGTISTYNLVLNEITGQRRIVMAIGLTEAQSIAVYMEGVHLPRPLSHDLMATMLRELGAEVSRVIIDDLDNGYFKSQIICRQGGRPVVFDARTSDAVALALRCQVPIFVKEWILAIANGETAEEGGRRSREASLEEMPKSLIEKKLSEAVESEDYETAQKLKDELRRRGE